MKITEYSNKTAKEVKPFYSSKEWKEARKIFLSEKELVCNRCGSIENICVDHIKPVRYYWDLRLEQSNFQLLCSNCNFEKGSSNDHEYWTLPKNKIKEFEKKKEPEYEKIRKNNKLSYLKKTLKFMIEEKNAFILKRKSVWLGYVYDKKIKSPPEITTVVEFMEYMYLKELSELEEKINLLEQSPS